MIIGSSTYAFSIVVALFLIGLAIGAWLVARKDRSQRLRSAILKVEAVTALSLLFSLFVLNQIPALLINLGLRLHISSWTGLLALQIFSATLLILVPAVLMGMVMPLVLVWASSDRARAVARVGRSYAVNTIGAIAGAFITGFILIPEDEHAIHVVVCGDLLSRRGRVLRINLDGRDPALKRSLAIGLIPVFVIVLFIIAPPMNLADLSIGAYDSLVRVLAQTREGVKEG